MGINRFGKIVEDVWFRLPMQIKNIMLDEFIVMPNHVHGIIVIMSNENESGGLKNRTGLINQTPTGKSVRSEKKSWIMMKNPKQTLGKIIRFFKGKITYLLHQSGFSDFKWQRNYYDHTIRSEEDLANARNYIVYNAQKWELDRENISQVKH